MSNKEIAEDSVTICEGCTIWKDLNRECKLKCSARDMYDGALRACKLKDEQFIDFLESHMGDEILENLIDEFKKSLL